MSEKTTHTGCHCACGAHRDHGLTIIPGVTRREFLLSAAVLTVGGTVLSALGAEAQEDAAPTRRAPAPRPLRVLPVLTYEIPQRRDATSWRSWGGIQTEQDAAAEKARIGRELAKMSASAGFPVEILPLVAVRSAAQAAPLAKGDQDVTLIYAAGGGGDILETLTTPGKWNLMFLRHDPGPVYLWYEIAHPRFLRKTVDEYGQPGWDVRDVVVDSYDELAWHLRGLHGLKNTLGKRIIAVGGAGGASAPKRSAELWKLDMVDYPYRDLGQRIQSARADAGLIKRAEESAGRYLAGSGTSLHTTREFVNNSFVLTEVLRGVMEEAKTDAITINSCMGTIMPMSKTTACLPLSLLNDEGYMAFCESDFVVIPSGILLHYISGKPVFLNDPTYPHQGVVTLAHCTAPRRMDGRRAERAKILTHFESDYGAAPKVEMKLGQVTTNLVPDFASQRWVGFAGTVVGNPFLDICRSQVDVRVKGDCDALLEEMKGFHWMLSYGDYLNEVGYALGKVGVGWHNVSAVKSA